MELAIRGEAHDLRSLRDWLRDGDGLETMYVRWADAPGLNGDLGALSDVLIIVLDSGGAGAALAESISAWIRHRPRDVRLTVLGGEPDALRSGDSAEVVRMVESALSRD